MAATMPLSPRDSGEFHAIRAQLRATLRRVRATKGAPDSTIFKVRQSVERKVAIEDELDEEDEET